MTKRIVFDLILFILIFILPWWLSIFLLFVGFFIFKNFYEFILGFIILFELNSLSFTKNNLYYLIAFSLLINILFLILQFIKSRIILYKN
jgi:hypothetical protein